jgi:6,7-dimethyl-8-ribityllumazine synthase
MGKVFEGRFDGRGRKVAVVASRFNEFFTKELVAGAMDGFRRHGVPEESVDLAWVPGSFELPLAAKRLAESGRYGAVVCVGCLIQGDTPHFHYIAGEVTKGVAQVALDSGVPVVFGIITAETLDQAIERAGTKAGNKGFDAATTALEMIDLFATLDAEAGARR